MSDNVALGESISGRGYMSATADVHYSFTSQFLWAAALFAQRAREIEDAAD
jgi:hypothetical protein